MIISGLSGVFDGYEWHQGPLSVEIKQNKIEDIRNFDEKGDLHLENQFLSAPFVDGHTHLIFAGDRSFELPLKIAGRSYAEILESGGGIHRTVKATREASYDGLKELVLSRLKTMLQHGSMYVEAKSGYGLTAQHELRLLEILKSANEESAVNIVPTYCGAHALPSEISRDDYVDEVISLLPEILKQKLATSNDVFCDRGAFTVDETRKIMDECKHLKFPVKVHADELTYTGIGKIAAEEYSAWSADHLLLANEVDFTAIAQNNTTAMFMPAATIGLFTSQTPSGWKNKGLNIGLGSDFNPNNMVYSMQTAIRLAVYLYRMDPFQAFKAGTSGSYKGIFGKSMLKLGVSSIADFIIIQAKSIPEFTTRIDQNLVSYVFKDGKPIFENLNI